MFVPIQNKKRARQLISFKGMELGNRLWPTDIDALIEWHGVAWLVFEVKHGDKAVPFGQKLALERFVRDVWHSGKKAVAAVVEHDISDPEEDVLLADCIVREIYVGGESKWRQTRRRMTAGELTRSFIGYVDKGVAKSA